MVLTCIIPVTCIINKHSTLPVSNRGKHTCDLRITVGSTTKLTDWKMEMKMEISMRPYVQCLTSLYFCSVLASLVSHVSTVALLLRRAGSRSCRSAGGSVARLVS